MRLEWLKYNKATTGFTLDKIVSMLDVKNVLIFHGPPGIGKSTLANLIADKFKQKYDAEVRVKKNLPVADVRKILEELSSIIYSNSRKLLIIEETDKMDKSAIDELIANTENLDGTNTGAVQINCILITNSLKLQANKPIFSRAQWIDFKHLTKDYVKKYIANNERLSSISNENEKLALLNGVDHLFNVTNNELDYRFLNAVIENMCNDFTFIDSVGLSVATMNLSDEDKQLYNSSIYSAITSLKFPTKVSVELNNYRTLNDIIFLQNYICKALLNTAVKQSEWYSVYYLAVKVFSNLNVKLVNFSEAKSVDNKIICQMNKLSILDALLDIHLAVHRIPKGGNK